MNIGKKQGIIITLVIVAFISLLMMDRHKESIGVMKQQQTYVTYLLYDDIVVEVESQSASKTIEKQIEEGVYYMQQKVSPFTPLLKEDTRLEKVSIKDGVATLDFSQLQYAAKEELHIVESLVHMVTQFSQVDALSIQLQGQTLSHMPINNTPLYRLDKNYGMNQMESNQTYLHQGMYYPMVYEIEIEKQVYPVIKSVKINHKKDYATLLDLVFQSPSVASQLRQPMAKYKIRQEKPCVLDTNTLHVYLSKEALDKKTGIKKDVVRYLQHIFADSKDVQFLSFHVNGEVIAMDGKNKIKR